MNAVEFVRKFGWEVAKNDLEHQEKNGTRSILYVYDDLKRLVESWKLVEFIGYDLDGAKQVYEFSKELKFLQMRGKIILIEDLRTAIADVESVGGGV